MSREETYSCNRQAQNLEMYSCCLSKKKGCVTLSIDCLQHQLITSSQGKHLDVCFYIELFHCTLKVPVNLSHVSRHDLAYFKARYSICWYMSHVSIKLRVLQRFFENSDSFLSTAQNWFAHVAHDRNTFEASQNLGKYTDVGQRDPYLPLWFAKDIRCVL